MQKILNPFLIFVLLQGFFCLYEVNAQQSSLNTLSTKEKKDGWILLFDGKTTNGWRGAHKQAFPDSGWVIKDGLFMVQPSGGKESKNGGDIVTLDEFDNFELSWEWRLSPGANSGVKYFVTEKYPTAGSAIGLEYQMLDDDKHPDAKLGKNGNRTAGSLYDLIPASDKKINPVGEFNSSRIVCKGTHVEHWLNGKKVVEYERGSEAFRKQVAESKYKDYQGFGEAAKGHILLQDHGDAVAFRNIKIKKL